MAGLVIGDKKSFSVSPKEGYGEYNKELVVSFEKTTFPPDLEINIDDELSADTPDGPVMFTVLEIGETDVLMDANHPLAGKALHFDIEVVSMRSATKEEIEHGHVHGADHHHH